MSRNILIIDGHPDSDDARLCHALAEAYADGAIGAQHKVKRITLAELDFPILRSACEFEKGTPSTAIKDAQDKVDWADHIFIIYPLWLGTMPALLKAFLEQVMRPGFAFGTGDRGLFDKKLTGRSARIVVTMGMPGFIYSIFYRAHSLKNLERNILKFCGINPARHTIFGMVEKARLEKRQQWLRKMSDLGTAAS